MKTSNGDEAVLAEQSGYIYNPNNLCSDKQSLCNLLSTLQGQVNELALAISMAEGAELHDIWFNLANARAYLTNALEVAHSLKDSELQRYLHHYQI